ncbi:MAG: helix-turn-helix domain-containing protein [Fimbriimonadales bacterium]
MNRYEDTRIIESSGNVFADLGFENPEEELAKSRLVSAISKVMAARRLTQAKVAEAIGIDQPQVSKLLRGRTGGYSTDRLIRILNQLDQDVEIIVRQKPKNANRPALYVVTTAPVEEGKAAASGEFVQEEKKRYGNRESRGKAK